MNHHQAFAVPCLLAIAVSLAISVSLPAEAEEKPEAAATSAEPVPAEHPATTVNEDREVEKQRKATAALLALCGILIGGLMFVAAVMIWGARLRRLARCQLPPQTTLHNEHWYLKPPKGSQESRVESQEPDKSQGRNAGS